MVEKQSCINADYSGNCTEINVTGNDDIEKRINNLTDSGSGSCIRSEGYYRLRQIRNVKNTSDIEYGNLIIPGDNGSGCISGISVDESIKKCDEIDDCVAFYHDNSRGIDSDDRSCFKTTTNPKIKSFTPADKAAESFFIKKKKISECSLDLNNQNDEYNILNNLNIKSKVDNCNNLDEKDCKTSWTTIDAADITKNELTQDYVGVPVQCIYKNNKCGIRDLSNKTDKKVDAYSNKYLNNTLDNKTDDLKYCPNIDKLDYKEYNNKSYLEKNTIFDHSELNLGCKNNVSYNEAKNFCNLYDDCDGFYIKDKNKPSRVCYKSDQHIGQNPVADTDNPNSAFYLKKKYDKYSNIVGFKKNLVTSSNLKYGYDDQTKVNSYGCAVDKNLDIKGLQDICDKNVHCHGITVDKNNKNGCFIKNINKSIDPINSIDDDRDIYIKTNKWKTINNINSTDSNIRTCSDDCKVDKKTGQILDNQEGCIYTNKNNSKYIHMGYPISETDWCPSDIITQKNFSIPTYSLSTAIKETTNINQSKFDNMGIEKCAKLCDKHNSNNIYDNWKCTGYSYRPTKTVPEYDSDSIDVKDWGKLNKPIGHSRDDPYICNTSIDSFTKVKQDKDGLKPVNTCEEINVKQRCKAGYTDFKYCHGVDEGTYDYPSSTKRSLCETRIGTGYSDGAHTCKFVPDNTATYYWHTNNNKCVKDKKCLGNYYEDYEKDYYIDGEECQLHGAYVEPYKEVSNKVDEDKIKSVEYIKNLTDKEDINTNSIKVDKSPDRDKSLYFDFKDGCVSSISIKNAKEYCLKEKKCNGFYTLSSDYSGKTCFVNIDDINKSKISSSNTDIFGTNEASTDINNYEDSKYFIYPFVSDFKTQLQQSATKPSTLNSICNTDDKNINASCIDLINILNNTTSIDNITPISNNALITEAYNTCKSASDVSINARELITNLNDTNNPNYITNINNSIQKINSSLGGCSKPNYNFDIESGGCIKKNTITSASAVELCDKDDKCNGFFTYDSRPESKDRICFKEVTDDIKIPFTAPDSFTSDRTKIPAFLYEKNINTNNPTFYIKNANLTMDYLNVNKGKDLVTDDGYYKYMFSNISANISASIQLDKILDPNDDDNSDSIYTIENPPPQIKSKKNTTNKLNINFDMYSNVKSDDMSKSCLWNYEQYNEYTIGKLNNEMTSNQCTTNNNEDNNITGNIIDIHNGDPELGCIRDKDASSKYESDPITCNLKYFEWNSSNVELHRKKNKKNVDISSTGWGRCRWNPSRKQLINGSILKGFCDYKEVTNDSTINHVNECDNIVGEIGDSRDYINCGSNSSAVARLSSFQKCDSINNGSDCKNSFYLYNTNYYPCEWTGSTCKGTNSRVDKCIDGDETYCCYNDPSIPNEIAKTKVDRFSVCDTIVNEDICIDSFYDYNSKTYPCEWNGSICKGYHSNVSECIESDDDSCTYNYPLKGLENNTKIENICDGDLMLPNCGINKTEQTCIGHTTSNAPSGYGYRCIWNSERDSCDSYIPNYDGLKKQDRICKLKKTSPTNTPTNTPTKSISKTTKPTKKLNNVSEQSSSSWLIILLVVLLVIGGGGYYLYNRKKSSK